MANNRSKDRQERLASALRENLKRRKARDRALVKSSERTADRDIVNSCGEDIRPTPAAKDD